MYHANINENKAGVVILLSATIDFGAKNITSDREGYYIKIKELLHQKYKAILHVDALN